MKLQHPKYDSIYSRLIVQVVYLEREKPWRSGLCPGLRQSRYYVHFRTYILEKDMNPLSLPAMG